MNAAAKTPKRAPSAAQKERNAVALQFAVAITGSTIIFEVLDKADGQFTTQVNRIAFELANDFMRRAAT